MSDICSYIRKNFTRERPLMMYFWSESITFIRPDNISWEKSQRYFQEPSPLSTVDLKELRFLPICTIVLFQSCLSFHCPLFPQLQRANMSSLGTRPSALNAFPSLVLVQQGSADCITFVSVVTWENAFSQVKNWTEETTSSSIKRTRHQGGSQPVGPGLTAGP